MKKIVIFGAGDHAKVVLSEIVNLKQYDILGFVDEFSEKGKVITKYRNKNFKNLGGLKNIIKLKNCYGVIGVGSNHLRKKIFKQVNRVFKKFKWQKIISKNAIIANNVQIGDGSVVISNCTINSGTRIGKHCLINTSSSIDHDNIFEDFSGTGPGVITGGKVFVGNLSYIGIGAIIKNQVNLGKNTFIGGSSFVNKDCKDNYLYFGVPARKFKLIKN